MTIGKDPRPSEEHIRRVQEMHAFLTPALREVARRSGYALAVHGSLERDIDLVAIPWRDGALSADGLIDDLFAAIKAVVGYATWSGGRETKPPPEQKPHGRLAWSILCGDGPYFDISVMPRIVPDEKTTRPKRRRK